MAVNKAVRTAHAAIDDIMARLLKQARAEGDRIPCCEGCSACCFEPLYATDVEAAQIADLVRAMAPADRARIERDVRTWVARFIPNPLSREEQPNAFKYRALQLPCPLLTADGRCSVYEARPIGCRVHVARTDPKLCEDLELRPQQQFILTAPLTVPPISQLLLDVGTLKMDHLVPLLHRELFGEWPQNEAAQQVSVEDVA